MKYFFKLALIIVAFFGAFHESQAQLADNECRISDIAFSYEGTLTETTPVTLTVTPDPETPACATYAHPFSFKIYEKYWKDDAVKSKNAAFRTSGDLSLIHI